jgi:hypothetical protein
VTFKEYIQNRDQIRIAIKAPDRRLTFDQPGPMGQGISGGIGDAVMPANLAVQSPANATSPGKRPASGTHQRSPAPARAPKPPSPPKPSTKVRSPIGK